MASSSRVLLMTDRVGGNPVAALLEDEARAPTHVDRVSTLDEVRISLLQNAYDCVFVMLDADAAPVVAALKAQGLSVRVIDPSESSVPGLDLDPRPAAQVVAQATTIIPAPPSSARAVGAALLPGELEALIAAMPDSVIVTDVVGCVRYMNHAARQFFEIEDDGLLGERIGFAVHPGTCALIDVRRSTGTRLAELRVVSCTWNGAPSCLAMIRDVTELAEAEAKLRQAQRIEAFGLLAGGIAHDFNNLLLILLASTEKIVRSTGSDEVLRTVATMTRAIEGSRGMVRNLMAFGGGDAAQSPARQEIGLVDLNQIVSGAYGLLRGTLPADVELASLICDQALPVLADAGQIEQIVVNLVINAKDALEGAGRIVISTSITPTEDDAATMAKAWACIRVTDTGVGIPPDRMGRIFEPFYSSKPGNIGSGLGLPTCHAIVTQLGGRIDVASEPGAGAEFTIMLPWRGEPASQGREAHEQLERARPANGRAVLVVDDNTAVVDSARETLERAGYRVLIAHNGVEAASVLKSNGHMIDLILTDLVMPVAGGFEVLQYVSIHFAHIPLVFMSSYGDRVLAGTDALKFSGYNVLMKPYLAKDLLEIVKSTLKNQSTIRQSTTPSRSRSIN